MNIRKALREYINEIDWENKFKNVSKTCLNPQQLVDDLNNEINRLGVKPNERDKKDMNSPIIPRTSIKQKDGEIDVDAFIKMITQKPSAVFGKNAKMIKTDINKAQYTMNTGLPAIVGIVYDEDERKFYYVNTCPGAGACKKVCYARRGSYVRIPDVINNLTQRLNLFLNHPEEYKRMAISEIQDKLNELELDVRSGMDVKLMIRWNDAGDFFTDAYYELAKEITDYFLKKGYNIQSYAYTKMGKYMPLTSSDFVMNFSKGAHKKELDQVDIENTKNSDIVPKPIFHDLFQKAEKGNGYAKSTMTGKTVFKDKEAPNVLKQRISKTYNVPVDRLRYTWELPMEQGEPNSIDVIVLPSDSDESAQRQDVKTSFLLVH